MKWILSISLVAALAGSSFAQGVKTPADKLDQYTERLTQQMLHTLDLSDEQLVQVRAINSKFIAGTMGEQSAGTDQPVDKLAVVHEMQESLQGVLSEEQYHKWVESQTARSNRTPEGREIQPVTPVK